MFGLPVLTAVFVFGGFGVAVVLSVVFALRFSADSEEWATLDQLGGRFRRRS